MPHSSAQMLNANMYPTPGIPTKTPYNETFTNYNVIEVVVRFLETDNEDPINSCISLEHKIKERFYKNFYLDVVDIKILKTTTFQKTHFINMFYNRQFIQKIENDDGSYKYLSDSLRNDDDKIIVEVPFETIDGKDYYNGNGFRCEIQELSQNYFQNIDENDWDVEEYKRNTKIISPEDLI